MTTNRQGDDDRSRPGSQPDAPPPVKPESRPDIARIDASIVAEIDSRGFIAGESTSPDEELSRISRTLDELLASTPPEDLAAAGAGGALEAAASTSSELASVVDAAIQNDSEAAPPAGAPGGHVADTQRQDASAAHELESILDGVFEDVAAVLGTLQPTAGSDAMPPSYAAPHAAHAAEQPLASNNPVHPAGELAAMDAAIASDLDAALSGGFDTVDDVLSDVFQKQASMVGDAQSTDSIALADAIAQGEQPRIPTPAPTPTVAQQKAPATPASPPATTASAPAPKIAPGQPASTAQQSSIAITPVPAPAIAASTDKPVQPLQSGNPTPATAALPTAPERPPRNIDAIMRAALSQLNFPLRLLPKSARTIVDFVALTLLFWVPIVWALALFVL
jgi:hypothetical protein